MHIRTLTIFSGFIFWSGCWRTGTSTWCPARTHSGSASSGTYHSDHYRYMISASTSPNYYCFYFKYKWVVKEWRKKLWSFPSYGPLRNFYNICSINRSGHSAIFVAFNAFHNVYSQLNGFITSHQFYTTWIVHVINARFNRSKIWERPRGLKWMSTFCVQDQLIWYT
jgi:hypothetical protein